MELEALSHTIGIAAELTTMPTRSRRHPLPLSLLTSLSLPHPSPARPRALPAPMPIRCRRQPGSPPLSARVFFLVASSLCAGALVAALLALPSSLPGGVGPWSTFHVGGLVLDIDPSLVCVRRDEASSASSGAPAPSPLSNPPADISTLSDGDLIALLPPGATVDDLETLPPALRDAIKSRFRQFRRRRILLAQPSSCSPFDAPPSSSPALLLLLLGAADAARVSEALTAVRILLVLGSVAAAAVSVASAAEGLVAGRCCPSPPPPPRRPLRCRRTHILRLLCAIAFVSLLIPPCVWASAHVWVKSAVRSLDEGRLGPGFVAAAASAALAAAAWAVAEAGAWRRGEDKDGGEVGGVPGGRRDVQHEEGQGVGRGRGWEPRARAEMETGVGRSS
jgi:hypothetical protein